jgi:hypothetical protein
VEREGQKVGAFEGAWHSDQGDRQQSPTAESPGAGPHDDSEIPLVGKEDGGVRSGSAMVVAFEQSSQLRGLASSTPIVLQRFLATDWGPNSSTRHRSDTAGQGHPEGFVQRSVKLMMNNSNHCYANACILSLTWMTLKMGALDTAFWPAGGFELFRNMTTDCWLPLCLKTCRPFLWLLGDGWSTGDLDIQNDAAEFLQWFLLRTRPTFINCSWSAQYLRHVGFEDLRDGSEKGGPHGLIHIPIFDPTLPECTLQHLIDMWHAPLGVCRAAQQVGTAIILHISRFLPAQSKCLQRIVIEDTVRFPIFLDDDTSHFHLFDVIGFVYHLGPTADCGHYRAVLKSQHNWLAYEDNQIPDQHVTLSDEILRNVVLVMLTPTHATDVRQRASNRTGSSDAPVASATPPAGTELHVLT